MTPSPALNRTRAKDRAVRLALLVEAVEKPWFLEIRARKLLICRITKLQKQF
jgi:hypothetical protein